MWESKSIEDLQAIGHTTLITTWLDTILWKEVMVLINNVKHNDKMERNELHCCTLVADIICIFLMYNFVVWP
jgi:hypothetical protein